MKIKKIRAVNVFKLTEPRQATIKPTWPIELKTKRRLTRFWARAENVPITTVKILKKRNMFLKVYQTGAQTLIHLIKNPKIAILGKIEKITVLANGAPS